MDEVAEVKSRLDIVEVVSTYVPLKQSGRNLKAPCPFHSEKTASFMVSPDKGIYHCFGCGEGGDMITFIEKMEGLDFRGALELLARRAGVELKAKNGESQAAAKYKTRLIEAQQLAVQYFQASLVRNPKALEYVTKTRGISRQMVKDFMIGYAPDSWNGLTGALQKRGFTAKELLDAGLARQKEGSSTIYDLFRGRIMFAICDRDGRPVGFTGRVLDDSLPKYMNTPQTAIYDKSSVIYGLHLAKKAIREGDEVVLVEGNMDVVASHQAGVRQVVATSGTALTLAQLRSLSKLTKQVKLSFDKDRAGLAATERAIELGQKLGLTLRMVSTGEAKDPDELIKTSPAAWKSAITEAAYIVDYLFERFELEYDLTSAIGKRQYSDRVIGILRSLADAIERDHYVKILASKLDVSEDAINEKIADESPSSRVTPEAGAPASAVVPRGDAGVPSVTGPADEGNIYASAKGRRRGSRSELEESVLAMALAYPNTRLSLTDIGVLAFATADRQRIYMALKEQAEKTGREVAASLTEIADYVNILLLRGEEEFNSIAPADRSFEAFGLARRLLITSNKDRKIDLTERLREAERDGDVGLVSRLLKDYQLLLAEEE